MTKEKLEYMLEELIGACYDFSDAFHETKKGIIRKARNVMRVKAKILEEFSNVETASGEDNGKNK